MRDEFLEALRAEETLTAAEHHLYGADVVEAFRDYTRFRDYLKARRPGLLESAPDIFQRVLIWSFGIADNGPAAQKWYCSREE